MAGVVAMVAGLICLSACGPDVTRHPDDLDENYSLYVGGPGSSGVNVPETTATDGSWSATFGGYLPCVADGDGPIEITGVSWQTDPATRPASVETYVRTFDAGETTPIGSALGNPEDPFDETVFEAREISAGVEGLTVTRPCADDGWPGGVVDEILVVVNAGPGGALIRNVAFAYTTPGGKRYETVTNFDNYLCGSEIPDDRSCG